jgi:hypothetical protein
MHDFYFETSLQHLSTNVQSNMFAIVRHLKLNHTILKQVPNASSYNGTKLRFLVHYKRKL